MSDQQSGPNAPLLASQPEADRDYDDHDLDYERQPVDLEPGYLGGRFIWALTFSAGISGLLFGYDTGVISSTLVSVGSDLSNHELTTVDKSLITSSTSLFALIASPLAGILADRLGRKRVILVADGFFTLGAVLQALTSQVWWMIVGRSVVGLAVGSASLVTPLYISELAPSHARGRLVTILSLFITGGQVVAYIVGWLFSSISGGWRWIVGLGAAPAILQFVILFSLPETPRWLVRAGRRTEAMNVLTRIYQAHPGNNGLANRVMHGIQKEVAEEEEELNANKPTDSNVQWVHYVSQRAHELFQVDGNRRALTIAAMLQGLQQLCGFNSLMYFSATIFSMLSFSSPTLTSLSVAMTNFVFTLFAFAFIDRIGRRRILLYSIPVMIISLIICALSFSSSKMSLMSSGPGPAVRGGANVPSKTSSLLPIAILLCLSVYTASYAFGLGNVPWQQSELFPLNVRSLGSALATATNWGSNFIVGLTFLPMMERLSPGWTFAAYAIVCTVGWVGVWAIYPEMSGLSLEEVKDLLADGWGVCRT